MDRRIDGKRFRKSRRKSSLSKIIAENIKTLDIYKHVTLDKKNNNIPSKIEEFLFSDFLTIMRFLPK